MGNLLEMLQGQLPEGMIDQLSQQMGTDKDQTASAANGVISTLLGALSQNASTPEGASALSSALDRDHSHSGGILEGLMGMIMGGGAPQVANPRALNGAGILEHIFGGKTEQAASAVSQQSGLDMGTVLQLMMQFAPMIMGMLGKVKQDNGLDASGLSSVLAQTTAQAAPQNPLMGFASQLLDKNHDGSMMDDIASMGMNILGNMFKK